MLYFLDPVLTSRAAIEPPTDFFTLEGGKVVEQMSLEKIRKRISKPEVVAEGRDTPHAAEDRFLALMGLGTGVDPSAVPATDSPNGAPENARRAV